MRVKGYKMSCVYIRVLINGEIGFEKIMDVSIMSNVPAYCTLE